MSGNRYDHAYLFGVVFWLAIWLLLFWRSPKHRRAMLLAGMALGSGGALAEQLTVADYWRPVFSLPVSIGGFPFSVEGFLLMFALGGICAAVFERVATRTGHGPLPPFTFAAFAWLTVWMASAAVLLFGLGVRLGVYSQSALAIAGVVTGLAMLVRHDRLLTLATVLAVANAAVYWLFYVLIFVPLFPGCFEAMWKLENSWGIRVGGVPLEEIAWAMLTMFFGGPLARAASHPISSPPGRGLTP
jgi:hypothetical protein